MNHFQTFKIIPLMQQQNKIKAIIFCNGRRPAEKRLSDATCCRCFIAVKRVIQISFYILLVIPNKTTPRLPGLKGNNAVLGMIL